MVTLSRKRVGALAALTVVVMASAGLTQPEAAPATSNPAVAPPEGRSVVADTPAAFKERLLRRIEFSQSIQKRLQEALDKLNAGGDPTEVRRMLEVQLGRGVLDGVRTEGGRARTKGDPQAVSGLPGGPRDGPAPDASGGPIEGGGRHGPALTSEEADRIRSVLARTRPALLAAIDHAKAPSPGQPDRTFSAMSGRLRGLDELEKANPALFELRLDEAENGLAIMRETKALFEARKGGDAGALERERAVMRELLVRQFDLRTRSQALQIDQLDKKVALMKSELNQAANRKDGTVERRLKEMLEWSEQGKSRRGKPEPKP